MGSGRAGTITITDPLSSILASGQMLPLQPDWPARAFDLFHNDIAHLYLIPVLFVLAARAVLALVDAANIASYTNSAPVPARATFSPRDVSVVCVIGADDDLNDFPSAIRSWLASNVASGIVIAPRSCDNFAVASAALSSVTTLPSYRLLSNGAGDDPLAVACRQVGTALIAVSPPGLIWTSPIMIDWLLAPFDQRQMGVVAPAMILRPVHADRLSLKELAFDMVVAGRDAQRQAHGAFSATLHSLPDMFIIQTGIMIAQDATSLIRNRLWSHLITSDWNFAFQKSDNSFVSVRCPASWSHLLLADDEPQRRLRRAATVLSSGMWRRHGLLAICILVDLLEAVLVQYLLVCLVAIAILHPAWEAGLMGVVLVSGMVVANLISMLVYWARHPADLIYLPLYICLNLARFCAPIIRLTVSWSRAILSTPPASANDDVCAEAKEKMANLDKKVPIMMMEPDGDHQVVEVAAAA